MKFPRNKKQNFYDQSAKLRLEREAMKESRGNGWLYFNVFFFVVVAVWIITLFTQDNFRSTTFPLKATFNQPQQYEVKSDDKIEFTKNGYQFNLTPLFEYDISGVVLSRYDYTFFSLRRTDSVFPVDLCLTWGESVKNGSFRNPAFNARQDSRWCYVSWTRKLDFNLNEFSNNHLVIADEEIEKKAFSIREGDQIRIKGKLVNVQAKNIDGNLETYEFESANWRTSQNRQDTGGGACEVIYVEDIEILQKGNEVSYWAHIYSGYLVLLLLAIKLFDMFFGKVRRNH